MIGSCRFISAVTSVYCIWSRNQVVSIVLTLALQKIQSYDLRSLLVPKESKDAFFAPPTQAEVLSPESFETKIDNEVGELDDFNWSFDQFDDFYSTYRDTIPPAAML